MDCLFIFKWAVLFSSQSTVSAVAQPSVRSDNGGLVPPPLAQDDFVAHCTCCSATGEAPLELAPHFPIENQFAKWCGVSEDMSGVTSEEYHGVTDDGLPFTFTGERNGDQLLNGCLETSKYKYTGEFKNNEYHGTGKLTFPNGNIIFEGTWNEGNHVNGFGKEISGEGEIYEGHFVDGKRSGEGRLRFEKSVSDEYLSRVIEGKPLVVEIYGTFGKESGEPTEGRFIMYQAYEKGRAIHCDFEGSIVNRDHLKNRKFKNW